MRDPTLIKRDLNEPVISQSGLKAVMEHLEDADELIEKLMTFCEGHPYQDDLGDLLNHLRSARRRIKQAKASARRLAK